MTEQQKIQRKKALIRADGYCYVCHRPLAGRQVQYAHKIANTQMNRRKYGSFVIDHTLNGEIVCSLSCNQTLNIGYNKGACLGLIADICIYEMKKLRK